MKDKDKEIKKLRKKLKKCQKMLREMEKNSTKVSLEEPRPVYVPDREREYSFFSGIWNKYQTWLRT